MVRRNVKPSRNPPRVSLFHGILSSLVLQKIKKNVEPEDELADRWSIYPWGQRLGSTS